MSIPRDDTSHWLPTTTLHGFRDPLRVERDKPQLRQVAKDLLSGLDDGIIRFWSDGAIALLRREPRDAIGRRVHLIIPEYFRDQHCEAFRHAMSVGALREPRELFAVPAQVAEDEVLPLVASLALVKDADGMAVGAIAVFSPQS